MIEPNRRKPAEEPVFSPTLLKILDWLLQKSDKGLHRRLFLAFALALWSVSHTTGFPF